MVRKINLNLMIKILITVSNKFFLKEIPEAKKIIDNTIKKTLQTINFNNCDLEISVLITSDNKIKKLNKQYRGINKPTNVLSFPMLRKNKFLKNSSFPISVGDIAISYETMRREAKKFAIEKETYLKKLIIHGALHLFGYDHDTDRKEKIMVSLEKKVLKLST